MTTAFSTFIKALLLAGILAGGIALPAAAQDTGAQFFGDNIFRQCQSVEKAERTLERMHYTNVYFRARHDGQHIYYFDAEREGQDGVVAHWSVVYNYCKGRIVGKGKYDTAS